ncbi:MAG TPA: multicopper oxidase family protein [Candidatus Acidoferrum sp.]|nr:multicopper oxidase family protein [Candidatus Acidoferrum sp.]
MSRRKFLGLGAGAVSVLGLGSAAQSTPSSPSFFEPEVRSSAGGFLSTRLRASTLSTQVQGQTVVTSVYEGSFPGPTLKVRPGDFLQIELINDLAEETNLHLHGLHVTPQRPGDDVLLRIQPGERFVYQYLIPPNHPGGTYFYHPHFHGKVSNQVFRGMSGLLIVEGDIDALPVLAGLPERSLVFQRTAIANGQVRTLSSQGGVGRGNVLVNGASMPTLVIRPGETQRWRLLNATVASLWNIQVQGHPLTLIARDGNAMNVATTSNTVGLATAQRRDVLIQGGAPGIYTLSFQDTQGPGSTQFQPFASLMVAGAPAESRELPNFLLPFEDLRTLPITRQRTITFNTIGAFSSKTFEGHGFMIDNQEFDEHRVDQFANIGDVDEWTVRNVDTIAHPFHIHINPFQVTHVNGQPVESPSYEDTTVVPVGGSITFRTRYTDFSGTFVYHCHILGHEDGGMMGVIQVACRPIETLPIGPGFRPTGPGFRPSNPFRLRPSCQ